MHSSKHERSPLPTPADYVYAAPLLPPQTVPTCWASATPILTMRIRTARAKAAGRSAGKRLTGQGLTSQGQMGQGQTGRGAIGQGQTWPQRGHRRPLREAWRSG